MHPATAEILRYFEYDHLPQQLAAVAKPFHDLAHGLVDPDVEALETEQPLLEGPEATAGLRKLLEAKDCFVRAALPRTR